MNTWMAYLVVDGVVVAAGAVGLCLHLRLVRFFDMGWAVWAMTAALVGVGVSRWSSSPIAGIAVGGLIGVALGALEDGYILRKALGGFIPYDVLERFSFSGGLAVYLILISTTEVLGFRDQEVLPPIGTSLFGLSAAGACSVLTCAGALACAWGVRASSLGIKFRALLDDSSVCAHYGFGVSGLAALVGALAGGLTGVASSCFGLIYAAHYTVGLSFMLLAVVPCILVGMRNSSHVIIASTVVVAVVGVVRFLFGYTISEYVVYGAIILVLAARPLGLARSHLREV